MSKGSRSIRWQSTALAMQAAEKPGFMFTLRLRVLGITGYRGIDRRLVAGGGGEKDLIGKASEQSAPPVRRRQLSDQHRRLPHNRLDQLDWHGTLVPYVSSGAPGSVKPVIPVKGRSGLDRAREGELRAFEAPPACRFDPILPASGTSLSRVPPSLLFVYPVDGPWPRSRGGTARSWGVAVPKSAGCDIENRRASPRDASKLKQESPPRGHSKSTNTPPVGGASRGGSAF